MARRCGCGGSACGCLIEVGQGLTIFGIGTSDDPYVINTDLSQLSQVLSVQDTPTVNLTLTGSGSIVDPMVLTAVATPVPFPGYITGGRPSAAAAGAGAYYYDLTLQKPLWSDGTQWRDAAGTVV